MIQQAFFECIADEIHAAVYSPIIFDAAQVYDNVAQILLKLKQHSKKKYGNTISCRRCNKLAELVRTAHGLFFRRLPLLYNTAEHSKMYRLGYICCYYYIDPR